MEVNRIGSFEGNRPCPCGVESGVVVAIVLVVGLFMAAGAVLVGWFAGRHIRRVRRIHRALPALAAELGLSYAGQDPWGLERCGSRLLPAGARIERVVHGQLGGVGSAVAEWVRRERSDGSGHSFRAGTIAFARPATAALPPCVLARRGPDYEVNSGCDDIARRLVPLLRAAPLATDAELCGPWLVLRPHQPGRHLTYNPLDLETTRQLLLLARAAAVALQPEG